MAQPPLYLVGVCAILEKWRGQHPILTKFFLFHSMSITKKQVIQQVNRAFEIAAFRDADRHSKFKIFCIHCDRLLSKGVITQSQHDKWTEIF